MGPASYVASYVPLLGQLVGCLLGAVAFGAAAAHALAVIAVAWIAHRPLLGASLLTVVVILVCGGVGVVKRGRKVD